jgi:soluble P-type ATPase
MLEIDIPGFGYVRLKYLVSDFTGTLSVDGNLLPGIEDRLTSITGFLDIHILTADTFGMVRNALKNVRCQLHILDGSDHDVQKEEYVRSLGAEYVVAFGNGNNDRKMLKAARIGIAVTEGEGCSIDAVKAADIHVCSAQDGLDLLMKPKRIKATLRF